MQIEKNKVVQFHYIMKDANGEELQSTRDGDPATYLHGHGSMFPGIEEAIKGKQEGDQLELTLPPEKTFGHVRENAQLRTSKKHIKHTGRYKVGDSVVLHTKEGEQLVKVVKIGHSMIDVDTNHPHAGKTLTFTIDVVGVRDANQEELRHGHAHGPGGHQH